MYLDQLGDIRGSRCKNAPILSESETVSRILKIVEDIQKKKKAEKDRQRIEGSPTQSNCIVFLFYIDGLLELKKHFDYLYSFVPECFKSWKEIRERLPEAEACWTERSPLLATHSDLITSPVASGKVISLTPVEKQTNSPARKS
jgi:hypothetical protein